MEIDGCLFMFHSMDVKVDCCNIENSALKLH